jgi:hypothetical protein
LARSPAYVAHHGNVSKLFRTALRAVASVQGYTGPLNTVSVCFAYIGRGSIQRFPSGDENAPPFNANHERDSFAARQSKRPPFFCDPLHEQTGIIQLICSFRAIRKLTLDTLDGAAETRNLLIALPVMRRIRFLAVNAS